MSPEPARLAKKKIWEEERLMEEVAVGGADVIGGRCWQRDKKPVKLRRSRSAKKPKLKIKYQYSKKRTIRTLTAGQIVFYINAILPSSRSF